MDTAQNLDEQEPAEQLMVAIYAMVADNLNRGKSSKSIENRLIEQGLNGEVASHIVGEVVAAREEARKQHFRNRSSRNMAFGALWFFGGLFVSIAFSGEGQFFLAYGAIIAGAIQFIIGLMHSEG